MFRFTSSFINPLRLSPVQEKSVGCCSVPSRLPKQGVNTDIEHSAMSHNRLQGYLIKKNRKLQESPSSK